MADMPMAVTAVTPMAATPVLKYLQNRKNPINPKKEFHFFFELATPYHNYQVPYRLCS
jgi:hypothetical protein